MEDHSLYALRLSVSGGLTLFIAWVIVRDLMTGITFTADGLRGVEYTSADNPIGYSIQIIFKIVCVIFFGAMTLHLIGVIDADPYLILKQALPPVVRQLLTQ